MLLSTRSFSVKLEFFELTRACADVMSLHLKGRLVPRSAFCGQESKKHGRAGMTQYAGHFA